MCARRVIPVTLLTTARTCIAILCNHSPALFRRSVHGSIAVYLRMDNQPSTATTQLRTALTHAGLIVKSDEGVLNIIWPGTAEMTGRPSARTPTSGLFRGNGDMILTFPRELRELLLNMAEATAY